MEWYDLGLRPSPPRMLHTQTFTTPPPGGARTYHAQTSVHYKEEMSGEQAQRGWVTFSRTHSKHKVEEEPKSRPI